MSQHLDGLVPAPTNNPVNMSHQLKAKRFWWQALIACLRLSVLLPLVLFECGAAALAAVEPAAAAPDADARWAKLAAPFFQNLDLRDGLPHLIATSLAQDVDGFLWVGTQGGLARWDGHRFHLYRRSAGDTGTLPDNYIRIVHVDRMNRLWVGTVTGGLARYDPAFDRFVRIPAGPAGISHVSIRAIVSDDARGIWVGTEGGLDHFNPETGIVDQLRHMPGKAGSLPDNFINALLVERNGTLWVGTRKGLVRRGKNGAGAEEFSAIALPIESGELPHVTTLFQAGDGRIWIGTRQHGAFVFEPKTGSVQMIHESDTDDSPLTTEWVYSMAEMQTGEMWIGTYGHGIVVVDMKSMQTRRIRHDATVAGSLADDTISAMLLDRSGLLWLSTLRGLSRQDARQSAVLNLFGASNRPDGVSDTDVRSVLQTKNGRVWLGLHRNGVDIIDPSDVRVKSMRPSAGTLRQRGLRIAARPGTALPKASVTALAEMPDGSVFMGTDSGLYRADQAGGSLLRLPLPSANPFERVGVLYPDGDRLWIGGANHGLWSMTVGDNGTTGPITALAVERLTDQRVHAIVRAPGNSAWIGTKNGLNLYHLGSNAVERFQPNPEDPFSLSAGYISTLLTDKQNRVWVGTFGGGINVMTGRDAQGEPRFRHLGVQEGLPNANVAKLLMAADGNIWASTDSGLAVIDPSSFVIRHLGRADGVGLPSYWNNSGTVTREGELLFGGNGGMSVVRPERYREWSYKPPVVITEIRINDTPIPASLFIGGATKPATLTILPDANRFSVEFAALDFSAPERNRYAYRLGGYDKDWIETDHTRRIAAYSNLQPGNYRLYLRGSNRNGVWAEQELALPIHVLPAWYQTWWMRLLAALVAATAIYALVQARTGYLRQRQRELERQVSERTNELQQKQGELVTANNGLNDANAELALSADTLRQLGDVGRDITANLDADVVFESLHRHIGRLLHVSNLAIYRSIKNGTALEAVFVRDDGQPVTGMGTMAEESPMPHAPDTACEVPFESVALGIGSNHVPQAPRMLSSLFAPLIIDEHMLGAMSIQSDRANAYGTRERLIFRTLCAYGAIALDNASTYRQLESTLNTLNETQTELLDKNVELARVNALQEEQQSELTRFLAVASHDLRQPMHALNLYLGALANFELPHPARSVLGNVRKCAQIMDDMFLALLDLSRLDAQVVAPYIERFPIASLLSSIEIEFAPQAKANGLQLRVMPCSLWIESDPSLVEQILRNLTANAIRYTESGSILIGCRRRGDVLRLAVFDTGIGIPHDQQKSVFEEFSQIGNAGHERTKGIGLGLAIVRRLSRLLGAPITLVSTPGKGSMFAIDLPRAAPSTEPCRPDRFHPVETGPERPTAPAQDALSGKFIVVVDDEQGILDAMRTLLEQWGCTVITADSAGEAIKKLSRSLQVPDAIICDYRLRMNENGLDVIKTLQSEFNHDIPALMITGTITAARIQELSLTGLPSLHKPVNSTALHDALLRLFPVTQH